MSSITKLQLKRLNTLYSQWAKHNLDLGENTRDRRIAEMSTRCGRAIASTTELTAYEAKRVIDGLQTEAGIPETRPAQPRSRRDREKAGTEGRRDQLHAESTLVSDGNIARIHSEMTRLGWDQVGLERWMRTKLGPLQGRTAIRTLGDANRVYWALKNIKMRQPATASATP